MLHDRWPAERIPVMPEYDAEAFVTAADLRERRAYDGA